MTLNIENLKAWGLKVWYPFANNTTSPICGKSLSVAGGIYKIQSNKDGHTSVNFNKTSLLYCASDPIFDVGLKYTIFMWVKCHTLANTFYLLGKWNSNTNNRWGFGVGDFGDYTGHPVFSAITTIATDTNTTVTLNEWYCISISCDNGQLTMYCNGIVTTLATIPVLQSNTYLFQLGGFTNFGEYKIYSDAELRHCMLFDQALSPAQIKALYEATYIE